MNNEDYSSYELEANAEPHITHSSHHLHIPKGYDTSKTKTLIERVRSEDLSQLEAGQNLGVFGLLGMSPINTLK